MPYFTAKILLFSGFSFIFLSEIFAVVRRDGPPLDGDYLMDESTKHFYDPQGPLINCSYLPLQFLNCSEPQDLKGNKTERKLLGYGCSEGLVSQKIKNAMAYDPKINTTDFEWGNERYEEVQRTAVWCEPLPGIECYGNRSFLKDGFPCIRYKGHYFVTTLLYSVLLGFLGMDRFCLGHTGTAVGKLLTVGGVGIWWIIDIILLVTGMLKPADDSNWVPYF